MAFINFPTTGLVANATKHQIGNRSWRWNGNAWDKDDHGHSGEAVVDSFNGLTGDVTGVGSFDGLTGSVLARNILPHIHLAGISSDGGATFGGIVNHSSDVNITGALDVTGKSHFIGGVSGDKGATFSQVDIISGNGVRLAGNAGQNAELLIKLETQKATLGDTEGEGDSTTLVVDDGNTTIELNAPTVTVSEDIVHSGDTNTKFTFNTDQIKTDAGGNTILEVNAGDFKVLTGISAAAGATFAGLVESSGISCGASTVGSVTLSSGVATATLFNGTATLALTANTATSATTATNVSISAVNDDTQYRIPFAAGAAAGTVALGLKSDSGNTSEGLFFRPDIATLTTGTVQALGVTLGNRGITFADGTGIVTATRTDSYTGQIETASDKTYIIDPSPATDRTITGYYIKSGAGTVTATLKNANDTVKAASVSTTSGVQSSLGNTSVSAGATMSIVTSSNSSATDVVFSVEYTTIS